MSRAADVADQTRLARFDQRLQRAARPQTPLHVFAFAQCVQVAIVQVIRLQALQGVQDIAPRFGARGPKCLGGEEDFIPLTLERLADHDLGLAIAVRGIDVVQSKFHGPPHQPRAGRQR